MNVETGNDNARRFAAMINQLAHDGRVIVVYSTSKNGNWPWMRNPAWQNAVTDILEKSDLVRSPEFHPADNVDSLCFSAISTAGHSSIEMLSLHTRLDGQVPPKGFLRRLAFDLRSVWGLLA